MLDTFRSIGELPWSFSSQRHVKRCRMAFSQPSDRRCSAIRTPCGLSPPIDISHPPATAEATMKPDDQQAGDEPDVTMTDGGEKNAGEAPDFDDQTAGGDDQSSPLDDPDEPEVLPNDPDIQGRDGSSQPG